MAELPGRPASLAPADLGFRMRRAMVPWLSPRLLASTGLRVVLASMFGAYADKREVQAVMPPRPLPGFADRDELWLDFVADLGDGFGPTYSVATLLAAPTLPIAHGDGTLSTERGAVLVMGGDAVYPTASVQAYQDQTIGPYRAALPYTTDEHPHLYAVPGNHDWYDGLTAFLRVFCRQQWIGGWQTQQSRSYFALELPHRWWLWGIDLQLEVYVDEPQLRYFADRAAELRPGDGVILCSAKPSWVEANEGEPEAYRNLDYFERTIIRPTGARVALAVSGDAHHYARYVAVSDGTQRITAGGGGAYTSATHHLPEHLVLPPPASADPGKSAPPAGYRLAHRWPSRRESAAHRLTIVAMPFRNAGLWALVGAVHALYLGAVQGALRDDGESMASLLREVSLTEVARGVVTSPVALLVSSLLVLGLIGFTKSHVWWHRLIGAVHAVAHVGAVILSIRAVTLLTDGLDSNGALVAATIGLTAVLGGLLGSWVMALYLAVADLAGLNANELFAAQRLRGYKQFLRLHIDRSGDLTVHPIGLRQTERRWRLRDDGPDDASWLVPARPLEPQLIEPPITIQRGSTA